MLSKRSSANYSKVKVKLLSAQFMPLSIANTKFKENLNVGFVSTPVYLLLVFFMYIYKNSLNEASTASSK